MISILLAIIYLAFISLGLPDSLLGSAWPSMQAQMNAPISYAGIISLIIAIGTIISSLLSDRLTKKLGTGLVTSISVLMTAVALFGFSISPSFLSLCLWAIPYGLGAGAVDAALNNYVALYFAPRHMSWLHCFWGVGAAASPYIMSYAITKGLGWNKGYFAVFVIQIILVAILFLTLPLWKKQSIASSTTTPHTSPLKLSEILQIKGVKYILAAFFGYCALESVAGLWASSYLVVTRGISAEVAAKYASFFYLGITIGRFISGFVANKIGSKKMIQIGLGVILVAVIMIGLPVETNVISLLGLIVLGLGCAPVYPSIIHSTPENFGAENSQAIIGVQMASAYSGTAFMPLLFGLVANHISMFLYPVFLLIFAVLLAVMTQTLNKTLIADKAKKI